MLSSQFQWWLRSTLPMVLLSTILYYMPWSVVWADDNFTGCGGEIVAAQNGSFEAAVVEMVNQQRAGANLPPLKSVPELTNAARYHSADMTQDNYFSHNSQDRDGGQLREVCPWYDRVRGYYTGSWTVAENIAWGYRSPADVMQGWMDSPGHRENIMGDFTEIGVGFYDNRWVQDFGVRQDVAAIIINREAVQATSPQVSIYIHGSGSQLRLRNNESAWSEWRGFQNDVSWTLPNVAGTHRVDIEVQRGSSTLTGSDTIVLGGGAVPTATPNASPTPTLVPTPTVTQLPPQSYTERLYLPLVTR